jgi:lipopolysaccharide biosynthesis regulator YciM
LGEVPNYYRAKRELIQVYLNKEEFDLAFDLAEETYSLDKYNPYNIQSYFRCLLKLEGKSAKSTLEKLLDDLKNNINPKADEMYRTSLTQFYAQIENDEEKALNTVNETILLYPKKIYPYLTKLEILNHSNNLGEINKVLLLIEERFDKTSEIWRKLHYLLAKCKILKVQGKITEAKQILNSDIKKNFSQSLFQKCETELSL